MVNSSKPWRTHVELDTYVEPAEEVREKILSRVSEKLGESVTDVDLVFCGMDGDEISKQNTPFLKGTTVFARAIEDVAGEDKNIDPIDYADEYEHPALVVYDRNRLHSPMDDGEYEASDDAVLGVLFIDRD